MPRPTSTRACSRICTGARSACSKPAACSPPPAGARRDAKHFYFGSVNWRSGKRAICCTWQPIFDGQGIGTIGALALAPSDPKILYVGTGESDMRSDIAQGDGVYKSTDAGKTWKHIGLRDSQQIARILVHPRNPELVYVAALGHPYELNVAERGVFSSRDGGKHPGKECSARMPIPAPIDLRSVFDDPNVYALWQTRRPP